MMKLLVELQVLSMPSCPAPRLQQSKIVLNVNFVYKKFDP